MGQQQPEQEYEIKETPGGAADPGIGLGDLIKYASILGPIIGALTSAGKVSFVVKALGVRKRVTVEDAV